MSNMSDTYIFHEIQESALCGQHALNSLLQESVFTPVDLAEIAQDLDRQERKLMMDGNKMTPDAMRFLSEKSGNVDESGNFSIQVLRVAIQRSHGIDLISWTANNGKQKTEITNEQGFIINRSAHWFTVRKIKNQWWNLNSTLEFPEVVSDSYVTVFLSQLINDGYTVFMAKGRPIPVGGTKPFGTSSNSQIKWYTERELLMKGNHTAEQKFVAFSGAGRRLTDKKVSSLTADDDPDFLFAQALAASAGDYGNNNEIDEDTQLAMAMSLSKAEHQGESSRGDVSSSNLTGEALAKERMRQKRLEALNKRGL